MLNISKKFLIFLTISFFFTGAHISRAQVAEKDRDGNEIFRHALNNFRYDSIRMYKSMDSLKAQEKVSPVYAQLLKSRYFAHNGDKNKSIKLVDSLIEHHQFERDSLRAFTSLYKAKLLLNRDTEKALETALDVNRRIGGMLVSDNFKGNLYLVLGTGFNLSQNYKAGLENYQQAELFFKRAGNRKDLAVVYNNLGNTFRRVDPQDKTILNYYNKAINILKDTSHQHIANIIRLNLLTVKADMGKDIVLEDVRRLEEYFTKKGDKLRLANTYKLMALYHTPSDIKKAMRAYNKALNSIANDNIHKVDIFINYIELLNDNGAVNKAEQELKKLKIVLDGFGHQTKRYYLKDFHTQMFRKDSSSRDLKSALRNLRLAKLYGDSIKKENYDEVVASERIKYETKQKELQLKKQKNKILNLQIDQEKQKKWVSISTAIISIFFIIASLMLYYNSKIKRKSKDLAESLQHNKMLFKELQHRVKNNLELLSGVIDFAFRNNTNINTVKHVIEKKVVCMSQIYDQLNVSDNIEYVNAKNFIYELIQKIIKAQYYSNNNYLKVNVKGLNFNITNKFAIELGLLINEFTLNAIKYAFKENVNYNIYVSGVLKNETLHHITLSHDGMGPRDKDVNLKYLELIAGQLKANLAYSCTQEGFSVKLTFK